MSLMPALSLLLALGLPAGGGVGALSGCAHDKQALRDDDKEKKDLSKRTELFWRAVRWQDPQSASVYIEDEDARRLWVGAMTEQVDKVRFVDVALQDLALGERSADPKAERVQEASVKVRVESYTLPAQVLSTRTVSQTWYRSHDGWFLHWESGDPLTGE